MSMVTHDIGTIQERWARFRFSVIGHLLAAPPDSGQLTAELLSLAAKEWRHPITGLPKKFGKSTIERWLYQAKRERDPVGALRTKRRTDAGKSLKLSTVLKQTIHTQYGAHPAWSYQLHCDNLLAVIKNAPELGTVPSYNSVRRYMKAQGFCKQAVCKRKTDGARLAALRLGSHEIRSYEVDHVHGLWHLDFHHGSRKILSKDGGWYTPMLLAILDDHSRLICHAQWYLNETTQSLVHGFIQAIQKRGLPRALMSDNGSAMTSEEFTQGLVRLGILHQPTLPYSPYQNGKQETFWGQVEGRLIAMLEGEPELSLSLLNKATLAWVEQEYHRKYHSEIATTPLERYLKAPDVGRPSPDSLTLRQAFCMQVHRKQRKSDGTVSLHGKRFEVPSLYRHLETVHLRYARWDLSTVLLIDPHHQTLLRTLHPQDKSANADGLRRAHTNPESQSIHHPKAPTGIAPLLKSLMSEYAATGLPPSYIPTGDEP